MTLAATISILFFLFFFCHRLFFLGFANHGPPSLPVLCHTNHLHVLSQHIHKPLLYLLPDSSIFCILLPIYLLWICPDHLNLASLTLSPDCLVRSVPLMHSSLILSVLVTPTEFLNIFSHIQLCLLSFCQCPQTKKHCWSRYPLVKPSFYFCGYPVIYYRSNLVYVFVL